MPAPAAPGHPAPSDRLLLDREDSPWHVPVTPPRAGFWARRAAHQHLVDRLTRTGRPSPDASLRSSPTPASGDEDAAAVLTLGPDRALKVVLAAPFVAAAGVGVRPAGYPLGVHACLLLAHAATRAGAPTVDGWAATLLHHGGPDAVALTVRHLWVRNAEARHRAQRDVAALADVPLAVIAALDVEVVVALAAGRCPVGGLPPDQLMTRLTGLPLPVTTLAGATGARGSDSPAGTSRLLGAHVSTGAAARRVADTVAATSAALVRTVADAAFAGRLGLDEADVCVAAEDLFRMLGCDVDLADELARRWHVGTPGILADLARHLAATPG